MSANSLKRTRTVQPVYPESARKRGVEGWVELAFTVMPNGTVEDVEVRNASPADVFDDAAVRAIRGWRFEPVERNGEKVAQRAMVRLRFAQSPNNDILRRPAAASGPVRAIGPACRLRARWDLRPA